MTGSTSNQALAEAIRKIVPLLTHCQSADEYIFVIQPVLDAAVREAESRTATMLYGLRQAQEKRHADELVAVREEYAHITDDLVERIQNEARLEAASYIEAMLATLTDDPKVPQFVADYRTDLEAKLAPKETPDEHKA